MFQACPQYMYHCKRHRDFVGEFLQLGRVRASFGVLSELPAYTSQLCHYSKKHVSFQAKEKYQEGSGGVTERIKVLSEVEHIFAYFLLLILKQSSESWHLVFAVL